MTDMTDIQELKEMFEQYTNDMEYLINLTEDLKDAEYDDDRENIYDSIEERHNEKMNNLFDLEAEINMLCDDILIDNEYLAERIEEYISDSQDLIFFTEDLKDAEYEDNQRIYDEISNEYDEMKNNMFELEKEILELIV